MILSHRLTENCILFLCVERWQRTSVPKPQSSSTNRRPVIYLLQPKVGLDRKLPQNHLVPSAQQSLKSSHTSPSKDRRTQNTQHLTGPQGAGASDAEFKPTFCKFCGKKFTNPVKYKSHEAYHRWAGRFPCSLCDKAFHCRENLVRHERIHTGERPFACTICGKTFTQKKACQSHESIHFK